MVEADFVTPTQKSRLTGKPLIRARAMTASSVNATPPPARQICPSHTSRVSDGRCERPRA